MRVSEPSAATWLVGRVRGRALEQTTRGWDSYLPSILSMRHFGSESSNKVELPHSFQSQDSLPPHAIFQTPSTLLPQLSAQTTLPRFRRGQSVGFVMPMLLWLCWRYNSRDPGSLLGALGSEGPGQATDLGAKLSTQRRVSRFVRLRGPEAPSHQGRPWLTKEMHFLEPLGKVELCCGASQMAHGSFLPLAAVGWPPGLATTPSEQRRR